MAFRVHSQWYRYKVLPFGLKWSPWIFTKLTRVVLCYWRSLDVMVTAYIDDFTVVAASWWTWQRVGSTFPRQSCRM